MTAVTSRRTRALKSRPFPPPLGPRLVAALARAHAQNPFRPTEARTAARRVAEVAEGLGLQVELYRGGVDLGAAEVDHVWAVVDGRVVDPALPLHAPRFVACVRAFVAGDVDGTTLEFTAHPYSVEWRIVGSFPEECRYVGGPVWSDR